MKRTILTMLLMLVITSCDTVENESVDDWPMSVGGIKKIETADNLVKVTVVVGIPTPCWIYHKTESKISGNDYYVKIYAKPRNNDPCIQVLSSFERKEKIYFLTGGEKNIRFWQNDSTYLDTTIVL